MRDSKKQKEFKPTDRGQAQPDVREVPYDGRQFFESFYSANIEGTPEDRMTIGWITDAEAKFHYNAVENSIIRAILRRNPPPANALVQAWRMAMKRKEPRLLDVGSGTGHWIDFMRDTFYARRCFGVEITARMAAHLREKYAAREEVTILERDVSEPDFGPELLGGAVDYVTAIGVMFHIVDDERWAQAVRNLSRCLKVGGLLLVGEDAGDETRNKEFHHTDSFSTWREFKSTPATEGEVRVSKRVRALSEWGAVAESAGLRLLDVVRSDREACITTPENDLLVLEKA